MKDGDHWSALLEHFEGRRTRAKQRLDNQLGLDAFHFALLGFECESTNVEIGGVAFVRQVTEPPGEVELARALLDKAGFGAIARYSRDLKYELSIDRTGIADQTAFNVAWYLISAMRVRSLAEFLVPAVSDHSWSVIAGLEDSTCSAQLLEDVPLARRNESLQQISVSDIEWAQANLHQFAHLLEQPAFRLAVESLTTYHHLTSTRSMIATLWAGIEALFGVESEITFTLAAYVASYLEPFGQTRLDRFRSIKKMYKTRSSAVHGSKISEATLEACLHSTKRVLSELICCVVEKNEIPTRQTAEALLFGLSD